MLYLITHGEYDDYGWLILIEGPDNLDIDEFEKDFHNKETQIKYFEENNIQYRKSESIANFDWLDTQFNTVESFWRTFYPEVYTEYLTWIIKKWNLNRIECEEISL